MGKQRLKRVLIIPERNERSFSACGWIRLVHPYMELHSKDILEVRIAQLSDFNGEAPDIIVSQRSVLNRADLARIESLKLNGTKFIFDLDDNLIEIPKSHSEYTVYKSKKRDILAALKIADLVTVSTQVIKEILIDRNYASRENVAIIKNELHYSWVDENQEHQLQNLSSPSIVYMSSPSHVKDWLHVQESIHNWLSSNKGIEVKILGIPEQYVLRHKQISHIIVPKSAQSSYPAFIGWYRSIGAFKVGIHPLEANSINAAKSNIKVLQYASQGTVTVASENRDITDLSTSSNFGFTVGPGEDWQQLLDLAMSSSLSAPDSFVMSGIVRENHVLSAGKGSLLNLNKEIEHLTSR